METETVESKPEKRIGEGGIPGTQPWWKDWVKVRDAVFNVICRYPHVHKEVMDSMLKAGVIDAT